MTKGSKNLAFVGRAGLRVEVFPSPRFSSRYDYFTGNVVRTIVASPRSDGIGISFDNLEANGMVEVYCRNVVHVIRNGVALRRLGVQL